MVQIDKPFLGCAYYPEDWDEKEIPFDISMMKKAGIKCARIGEFAWRKMEPAEGKYDFKWLHHVVDSLKEAGIAVVMGTPTATPPIWLSKKFPAVLKRNADGTRIEHGGRRHCCSNNPDYLAASDRIVEMMGKEFGDDENIIGWQLDNEIYTWGSGCVCEYCMKNYHEALEKKYGTVENLNAAWNLNLFSQAYDDFSEIPFGDNAWHNPHLLYEWKDAHYKADIRFMHRQAGILKKYTKAPIGTDMMPLNGMGYEEMNEKLDIVMFNHYNVPENITDEVFWFDFLRTLKERPFWNTETATTWNGSVAIGQFLKPEGWCRLNSWLPVALGGEANMYWLFRQHWAGHELTHGSVISPEGRPCHAFSEIQKTSEEYEKAAGLLNNTAVKTPVALHFTSESWKLFEEEPLFDKNSYIKAMCGFHKTLSEQGLIPDVIGSSKPLEDYKVIFSPMVMTLEDRKLSERIRKWVSEGGVWVAGPMTDIRSSIGAHFTDRAMGMLEEMLGIRLDYQMPNDNSVLKAAWTCGEDFTSGKWVECYTLPENGEALAAVTAGHSALTGKSIVSKLSYGKGEVILLGTLPSEKDLQKVIDIAYKDAGIAPFETAGSLLVIPREGDNESGLILAETAFKEATVVLPDSYRDILTGETLSGKITVKPYDVMVLKKEDK